ncbi:MAG: redoxin domain-containing protein [Planctomycetota bacterium]
MRAIHALFLSTFLGLPALAQEPAKETPPPAEKPRQQDGKPDAPKTLQLGARVDGKTTLADIDGNTVTAHEFMGKVTVISFYSIQCPIQAAWDSRLAQIQKDFAADGVVFLHIDSNVSEIGEAPPQAEGDAKPYANIRDHLKAKGLPFRVLVDHGNKVADLFDARTTPHVYVFGKDGKLVYKGLVDDDQKDRHAADRNNYLRDVLGKLLKDEKVEPFATKEQGCSIKRVGAGGAGGRSGRGGGRGSSGGRGGNEGGGR